MRRPSRIPARALLAAALMSPLSATVSAQERTPPKYDVVVEHAQGIVRGVMDGGQVLLLELRRDTEMLTNAPSMTRDFEDRRGDPSTRGLLGVGVGADHLRRLDLRRADGWVFVEDPDGGPAERIRLAEAGTRFRDGQILELGGVSGLASRVTLLEATGRVASGRPDPNNPIAGVGVYGGQVATLIVEGWVHLRVNRAFE